MLGTTGGTKTMSYRLLGNNLNLKTSREHGLQGNKIGSPLAAEKKKINLGGLNNASKTSL